MKVGIITLVRFNLNYGNTLQNYALQVFLKRLGIQSETILDKHNNFHEKFKWINFFRDVSLKEFISIVLNRHNCRDKLFKILLRQKKYLGFEMQHLNFSESYTENLVPNNCLKDKYDKFIIGSDQVWNYDYGIDEFYFAKFADKSKRIAYAASFGISQIPQNLRGKYKEWLNEIEFISVRENAGAAIIKDLIGKDVPVLVDPTLLLTKEEWLSIAKKPDWFNDDKYILTYFLGEKLEIVQEEINILARKYNLKIVNLLDDTNMDWYCMGPSEFVYLVQHCSLMCTDSFHGTAFSILMRVPFVVYDRVEQDAININSRLDNILDMFNLQSRRGTIKNHYKIEQPMEIDYSHIDEILSFERKRSEYFIKEALRLE